MINTSADQKWELKMKVLRIINYVEHAIVTIKYTSEKWIYDVFKLGRGRDISTCTDSTADVAW